MNYKDLPPGLVVEAVRAFVAHFAGSSGSYGDCEILMTHQEHHQAVESSVEIFVREITLPHTDLFRSRHLAVSNLISSEAESLHETTGFSNSLLGDVNVEKQFRCHVGLCPIQN